MKKNWFIIFAALCAAATVSCSKETAQPEDNNPATEGPKAGEFLNPVTLTFTADPSTKVAISDKGVASWEEGDLIDIVSFDSQGTARKAEGVEVKEGGTFSATVEDSDTYYAVYPSSSATAATMLFKKTDGVTDSLVVTIPATQDGTLKHSIYYAAKTSKTAKQFDFKAVSGILKFEAAKDYTVAQIRNVENEADRDALHGVAACEFDSEGNVTVTPKHNFSSTHTINLDGSGTYYAAIVGNATNEFVLRFKKAETAYEPGVFKNKTVTFTPGKIKNCGNLTDKIHTDLYLSPSGTGDGLSKDTPASYSDFINSSCLGSEDVNACVAGLGAYAGVWNCWRRDGLTVHLAAGEYASGFKIAGTGAPFTMTIQGTMTSSDTTKIGGLCTFSAYNAGGTVNTLNNIKFYGSTTGALSITAGEYKLNSCVFQKCTTKNTVVIGSKSATDENLKVDFKNCLFTANTIPSYGVINSLSGSTGGIAGFHNCRFENNVATSGNGAAIGCNGSPNQTAILLNKCTFIGNSHKTSANGYNIYMNSNTSRLAMNSCTINSGGSKAYSNGSSVAFKGQSIIANSTIWSSGNFGKWGLVALGCHKDNNMSNGALVINSVMRQVGTSYPAYYFNNNYNQNLNYCLHSGADLTVVKGTHTVDNTVKVSSFASAGAKSKSVDGITAYYYTWNYASTTSGSSFTKPSAETVRSAISATGETSTGTADGIGGTFLTWLDGIDENWLTEDLIGTSRPSDGLCPGSVEQAN